LSYSLKILVLENETKTKEICNNKFPQFWVDRTKIVEIEDTAK